jgi:hypothetical protein
MSARKLMYQSNLLVDHLGRNYNSSLERANFHSQEADQLAE